MSSLAERMHRLARAGAVARLAATPEHLGHIRNFLDLLSTIHEIPRRVESERPRLGAYHSGREGAGRLQMLGDFLAGHDPHALMAYLDSMEEAGAPSGRHDVLNLLRRIEQHSSGALAAREHPMFAQQLGPSHRVVSALPRALNSHINLLPELYALLENMPASAGHLAPQAAGLRGLLEHLHRNLAGGDLHHLPPFMRAMSQASGLATSLEPEDETVERGHQAGMLLHDGLGQYASGVVVPHLTGGTLIGG